MKVGHPARAFSLIEVIIAVGIFAGTVTVVIGLMAALSRQAADSTDFLAAQRLPDALRLELNRLAASDFDSLAAQIPVMSLPLEAGLALAASRDSAAVESLDYLPPAGSRLSLSAHYFLIECWRYPGEPLRYDAQKAFLALHVRVSWPCRAPGAVEVVPLSERSQVTFALALNR
jgi:hypothetical protein